MMKVFDMSYPRIRKGIERYTAEMVQDPARVCLESAKELKAYGAIPRNLDRVDLESAKELKDSDLITALDEARTSNPQRN